MVIFVVMLSGLTFIHEAHATCSTIPPFFTCDFTETVNVSDSPNNTVSKQLSETATISDTVSTVTAFSKSLSEQLNVSDTVSTVTAFSQSISEQVNISDTLATTGVFFRSLSEQVNVSETVSLVTGFSKSLSEQINISDTLDKLTNKEIIETIRISDSLNNVVQTPKTGGGGGDSSPPSFGGTPNSETEYLFFNYGTGYRLSSYSNTLPTKLLETGKPQIIKLLLYEDSGPSAVEHIALYTNLRETAREIADSDTYIIYERNKPLQVNDPNKFFSNVNVTTATEDNKLAITFNMTFSKHMEKSDIILRAWDERRNSVDTRILDAWKVVEPQQENPPKKAVVDLLSDIKKWAGYSSSSISDSELLKDVGINAQQVPSWFKKTVRWLVSGETSIEEFVDAIKYMHERGIVK